MAVKKKSSTKKKSTVTKKVAAKKKVTEAEAEAEAEGEGVVAKDKLVHIQADEALVMRLKIIAARHNKKMYELVNEVLTLWLQGQTAELKSIADLFSEFKE